MKWWSRSGAKSAAAMAGSRPAAAFGIGTQAFPWLDPTSGVTPGGRVTRAQALAVPAVLRGRNLIAGTIASLPICTVDAQNRPLDLPLFRQIDPDVPNSVTMAMTVEDLLFEGLSWWRVTGRSFDGYPSAARHIDFAKVSTQIPPGFPLSSLPSGYFPGSHIFMGGEAVPARDVIRFDSPNPPLLVCAGRAILRALKLEVAADRYADDPAAREYFTATDGADPDEGDVTAMLDGWLAARQQRAAAYIPSGFERHDVNQMSPADLQLAQLQDKATLALANAMGLDPEDLGVSTTSRTYQNAVDRRQDRVNECYGPYMQAIGDRLSMGDVTRRGQKVRFDLDDFLKSNPVDRATVQQTYKNMGVLTVPEIREQEYLPPLEEQPAPEQAPQPAQPPLSLVPAINAASDDPVGLVFDTDGIAEAFAVNENRRTITGVVVPWGKIGRTGGRKWRFEPGALKFSKSAVNRIKLLNDHDSTQAVGHLLRTWSDDTGQWATFKVARGPAGDQALGMAADGVKDGLSVGIGFEGDQASFTYSPDPQDGSVSVVTSAPWRETSLVAMPAFEDARTTAVAMAADEGVTAMSDESQAAGAVFDQAALTAAVNDAVAAAFAARDTQPGPTPVNPMPQAPVAQVNEPPLYRFDGGKAQHSFSGDIAKAARGDQDAKTRLEKYANEHMAALFANISTTNTAELNPTPTRPELFVPQMQFSRPLGDQVTTGGLDSITAFIIPKYNSSSGLAAAHTPGTDPSDGAWDATGQTVTPVGISGQVTINREVIDQGGNPQADMIIYSDMVKAYYELLEQRIVNLFQGLSLSDTAVVGVDGDLQDALLSLFAGLQFLRGGDIYNGLAADSTLYKALVGARDQDGRALFPINGPTNAQGDTAGDLASVRVGGKVAVPAWACESANGGDGKGYLFARQNVYQWASAPQRFDFREVNVASVVLGIWGYSAEAATRSGATDIYQLAYSVA